MDSLKAHVLWLVRDEGHGRLLIRFRAPMFANGRIEARDGVLGDIKDDGIGAESPPEPTRPVFFRLVNDGQVPSGHNCATTEPARMHSGKHRAGPTKPSLARQVEELHCAELKSYIEGLETRIGKARNVSATKCRY